jgi:hypothetical protein
VLLLEAHRELRELAGEPLEAKDLEEREPRLDLGGAALDGVLQQLHGAGERAVLVEEARALHDGIGVVQGDHALADLGEALLDVALAQVLGVGRDARGKHHVGVELAARAGAPRR